MAWLNTGMEKPTFDIQQLRLRLAAQHGQLPLRDPEEFAYRATVLGLCPQRLGRWCCVALQAVRRHVEAETGGAFALVPRYDPETHERIGYDICADDPVLVERLGRDAAKMVERALIAARRDRMRLYPDGAQT